MMQKGGMFVRILGIIISLITIAAPARSEVQKSEPLDKVATVNGMPIDRAEFDGELLRIQKALFGFGKPLTCDQITSVQTDVLESLIRREILYQESRKSGIKPDEDAVKKEIENLKKQFADETEYRNELRRRNISEDILRARMVKNSSIQQYIKKEFAAKSAVTDGELLAYYQGNLDAFTQPLQIRVSHILVQTDPKWEASRKQEARKKIDQILKNLKKGQDFGVIAREQSDGPTRTNGGDLGYIKMGQLEKQFEGKVFALNTGETSDIIETDYGFHLFKVLDKKPETILAYDAVKEKIRQFLVEEKAKQEAEAHAKTLRQKANVKILLAEQTQHKEK